MDVIYSCEVLIVGGLIAHGLKHFFQLVFSIKVFRIENDFNLWYCFTGIFWSKLLQRGYYYNVTGLKMHDINLAINYTDRFLLHLCRVTTSLIIMVTVIWRYTNKIDHLIKFSNLIIITNAIYGKYSCFMFQWFV